MKRVVANAIDEDREAKRIAIRSVLENMSNEDLRQFFNYMCYEFLDDTFTQVFPMTDFDGHMDMAEYSYVDVAQLGADSSHFSSEDAYCRIMDGELLSAANVSDLVDIDQIANTIIAHPGEDYDDDDINAILGH